MIFAFKNTASGIVPQDFVELFSDYTLIKNIYITNSAFYFANEAAITNAQNIRDQITLGNLIPLYNANTIEANHEDPIKYTGIQDREIEIYKGKYKFTCHFNYNIALYKKVLKLHNKPVYIYIQDRNNNFFGILDGTDIFGIRCELFTVHKLVFGSADQSGLKISVTIDGDEIDNIINYTVDYDMVDLAMPVTRSMEEVENIPVPVIESYTIDTFTRVGDILDGFDIDINLSILDNLGNPSDVVYTASDITFSDAYHTTITVSDVDIVANEYVVRIDRVPIKGTVFVQTSFGIISKAYDFDTRVTSDVTPFLNWYDVVVAGVTNNLPDGWFGEAVCAGGVGSPYDKAKIVKSGVNNNILFQTILSTGGRGYTWQLSSYNSAFSFAMGTDLSVTIKYKFATTTPISEMDYCRFRILVDGLVYDISQMPPFVQQQVNEVFNVTESATFLTETFNLTDLPIAFKYAKISIFLEMWDDEGIIYFDPETEQYIQHESEMEIESITINTTN